MLWKKEWQWSLGKGMGRAYKETINGIEEANLVENEGSSKET